jgi:hypothetical protein
VFVLRLATKASHVAPEFAQETGEVLDRLLEEVRSTPAEERGRQNQAQKTARLAKVMADVRLELPNLSWPITQPCATRELFTAGACTAFAFVLEKQQGGQVRHCKAPAHFWVKVQEQYWDVTGQYSSELELLQSSFEGLKLSALALGDFLPEELEAQIPKAVASVVSWNELCGIAERLLHQGLHNIPSAFGTL